MQNTPKRTRGKLRVESAAPAFVSQRNCTAVLGISQRQHLRLVRAWDLPVRRVGQAVLVPLAAYVDAIDRYGLADDAANDDTSDAPSMADVMAALGVADA